MALPAKVYSSPLIFKVMHFCLTLTMALVSGVAVSLSLWVVPIMRRATSTKTRLDQFQHIIDMGFRYLQPNSRIAGALLLILSVVYYNHPDNLNTSSTLSSSSSSLAWWQSGHESLKGKWIWYVVALCMVVPLGPWEENLIFPINDKLLKDLKPELAQIEKEGNAKNNRGAAGAWDGRFGDKRDQEVDDLFTEWNKWHIGRIAGSFACTVVLIWIGMDGRF